MTEPKPSTQYTTRSTPPTVLIHLRDGDRGCVGACGISLTESVITTDLHHSVTCPACLALIAADDPVLLLEPWLQKAVRKLVECRARGDNFGGLFFFRRFGTELKMQFHKTQPDGVFKLDPGS